MSGSEHHVPTVVIGIDVGGPSKGFHAVALEGGRYRDKMAGTEIDALVRWCRDEIGATVIAIDAPCAWSDTG